MADTNLNMADQTAAEQRGGALLSRQARSALLPPKPRIIGGQLREQLFQIVPLERLLQSRAIVVRRGNALLVVAG